MALDREAIGSLGFDEYLRMIEDRYAENSLTLNQNKKLPSAQVNELDDEKSTHRKQPLQSRKLSAAQTRNRTISSRQTEPASIEQNPN